jgi:predicted RNase H-like nuclease (RuvC/YqgF family)
MELTEEKLQELLEKAKAGEKIKLFDQEELNGKIKTRLDAEKPKIKAANEQIAQLQGQFDELKKQTEDAKKAAEMEGKTELEKAAHELSKHKDALKALRAEKKAAEAKATELHNQRKGDFLDRSLSGFLLRAERFNPDAIKAALLEAKANLGDVLEVAEDNGSFLLKATTPDLDNADPAQLIKDFVAKRSYFQIAKPSGGGADPSKAGGTPTPKDWKEGKNEGEQWATAFNQFASGPAGKPTKEGGAQT